MASAYVLFLRDGANMCRSQRIDCIAGAGPDSERQDNVSIHGKATLVKEAAIGGVTTDGHAVPLYGLANSKQSCSQCLAVLEFVIGCQKLGDGDGQLLKGRWLRFTKTVFLQQLNVVKLAVCVE